jgi:hypothetical protein
MKSFKIRYLRKRQCLWIYFFDITNVIFWIRLQFDKEHIRASKRQKVIIRNKINVALSHLRKVVFDAERYGLFVFNSTHHWASTVVKVQDNRLVSTSRVLETLYLEGSSIKLSKVLFSRDKHWSSHAKPYFPRDKPILFGDFMQVNSKKLVVHVTISFFFRGF